MSYIRVPADNTDRLSVNLRGAIDRMIAAHELLRKESETMNQLVTGAEVEQEYKVETGLGDDLKSLVVSTVSELDNAPFWSQLRSRVG